MQSILQSNHEAPEVKVHLLPCRIDASGPAPVSSYFLEQSVQRHGQKSGEGKEEGKQEHWEARLRGRLLIGHDVPVPEGYQGHVYQQEVPSTTGNQEEGQGRVWREMGQWRKMRLWGQDYPVDSERDLMVRTLGPWARLADAISQDPPADWEENSEGKE
ncbi:MAG: ribonuclease H2, subunit C [Piptocephalis tieghemiana]|nr:MAG: ribonuclease H2, subunit C [Piptocephalis tieghemiana]